MKKLLSAYKDTGGLCCLCVGNVIVFGKIYEQNMNGCILFVRTHPFIAFADQTIIHSQ